MLALRNDDEPRTIDATRHFLGKLRGRQLISVTDDYGCRTPNTRKIGPRVGARHVHLQMPDKGVRSALHRHSSISLSQYLVTLAARMNDQGELEVEALAEPGRLSHRDPRQAPLGLLCGVGSCPRIDKGEARDTLASLS